MKVGVTIAKSMATGRETALNASKAQDNLRAAEKQHMKLIQGHPENEDETGEYDQNQVLTETDPFLEETQEDIYAQLNN